MPLSRDSSYDDWDPDFHLPVIEETETVFYGEEEDDAEDVAAHLPEPQGHPKAMGPEPAQPSALAETNFILMPVPEPASHAYSPVMCLVCQAQFNTLPTYLDHLRSVQHHWNMGQIIQAD